MTTARSHAPDKPLEAIPWLASLALRPAGERRPWLAELRDRLASLPRRLRRRCARRWRACLRATALALALSLAGGPVDAATITVGGACTLADANAAANTDAAAGGCPAGRGADAIELPSATLSLTRQLPDITSEVTISGDATVRRVDDAPDFGILRVVDGGDLTLSGVTLAGGDAGRGGGLLVLGATAELTNVTISGNTAEHGGGISLEGGSLGLTEATITGNRAITIGGGLYQSDGTATLAASQFGGNVAGGYGGGIAKAGGVVSLTDSTITGNTSGTTGAGIHNKRGLLSMMTSAVSGNRSTAGDRSGAGIYNGEGRVTLSRTVLSGNVSGGNGGGLANYFGTVFLTDSTVSDNTADYAGGGLDNLGSMTVNRSTISGNVAYHSGGIYNYGGGVLSLNESTLSGNSAMYVGALYNGHSTARLVHTTITGNTGREVAAGVYNYKGTGTVTVLSSIIAGQSEGANCAGGDIRSGGFNIESGAACGFEEPSDVQNMPPVDLRLGPLALNAPGTTATHALLPGSFALDRIPSGANGCGTSELADQRGVRRPQPSGGHCDVGAFEREQAGRRGVYLPVAWR